MAENPYKEHNSSYYSQTESDTLWILSDKHSQTKTMTYPHVDARSLYVFMSQEDSFRL